MDSFLRSENRTTSESHARSALFRGKFVVFQKPSCYSSGRSSLQGPPGQLFSNVSGSLMNKSLQMWEKSPKVNRVLTTHLNPLSNEACKCYAAVIILSAKFTAQSFSNWSLCVNFSGIHCIFLELKLCGTRTGKQRVGPQPDGPNVPPPPDSRTIFRNKSLSSGSLDCCHSGSRRCFEQPRCLSGLA